MASYLARVYVSLKPTVNDPQGLTIADGLRSLGFSDDPAYAWIRGTWTSMRVDPRVPLTSVAEAVR